MPSKTIQSKGNIIVDYDTAVDASSRFPKARGYFSWDRARNLTADGYQYSNETDFLMSVETFEELEGAVGESVSMEADIILDNTTERFLPKDFKNKLRNPSFELNATPTYWTLISGSGAINTSEHRSRIRSYKLNSAASSLISDNMYIASGLGEEYINQDENWVFSIYMSGNGNAALRLFAFDTTNSGGSDFINGLLASNIEGSIALTGSWARSQVSLVVPSGTASLKAMIELQSGSELYADDGMVERGATATDFFDVDEYINHLILPNRPSVFDLGFSLQGVTASGSVGYQRVFGGLTQGLVPDLNEEIIKIHCIDLSSKLMEMTAPSIMYANKRTDELLEYLALAAGLGITEYSFEQGLLTIPFVWFNDEESIWWWMKEVAEAENGRIFFDTDGILRFWNRDHYKNNKTALYNFSFDSNMTKLDFEVSSEKIINHVKVVAKPRELQPNQIIWILQGYEIIPVGEYLDYEITVDDPCNVINEPVSDIDYLGNSESDGSGTDLTSYLTISDFTPFAKKATMRITNTHPTLPVYLTFFQVKGEPATILQEMEIEVKDTDSISLYRDRNLDIENDFMQDIDGAEALAKRIIIEKRNPLTFLEIDVVGNPAIRAGDVVRVQDSYSGITKDLFVSSVRNSFSGGAMTQVLKLESKILEY